MLSAFQRCTTAADDAPVATLVVLAHTAVVTGVVYMPHMIRLETSYGRNSACLTLARSKRNCVPNHHSHNIFVLRRAREKKSNFLLLSLLSRPSRTGEFWPVSSSPLALAGGGGGGGWGREQRGPVPETERARHYHWFQISSDRGDLAVYAFEARARLEDVVRPGLPGASRCPQGRFSLFRLNRQLREVAHLRLPLFDGLAAGLFHARWMG